MTPSGAPVPDATLTATSTARTSGADQVSQQPGAAVDSSRAWIVVAATFLATFTVFGVVYSFGGFFTSMADDFGTGKGATTSFSRSLRRGASPSDCSQDGSPTA